MMKMLTTQKRNKFFGLVFQWECGTNGQIQSLFSRSFSQITLNAYLIVHLNMFLCMQLKKKHEHVII